jgi:protein-disulfide isomerase
MSEENTTSTEAEVTTSQAAPTSTGSVGIKDLLIPVSIIFAGVFVGAGLYFGGGSAVQEIAQVVPPTDAEADNTNKVNPITEDDHVKGNPSAPIKIIEFSDFDCPFCSRFHDVMNSVVENSNGEVLWAYRQFPLEQLHPQAVGVAMASECVAELGGNDAFWSFADGYLEARGSGDKTPHSELIPKLVVSAGINQAAFTECFESERHASSVQDDINNAVETGGRGTPWSIIVGPTGKTYPVNGALPQSAVEQLIEVAKQEA